MDTRKEHKENMQARLNKLSVGDKEMQENLEQMRKDYEEIDRKDPLTIDQMRDIITEYLDTQNPTSLLYSTHSVLQDQAQKQAALVDEIDDLNDEIDSLRDKLEHEKDKMKSLLSQLEELARDTRESR